MQWLEYVAKRDNIFIEYDFNGVERKIGSRHIFVYGFCAETNTIFQFQGCHWHGHVVTEVLGKEISCPLNFDCSSGK